MYDNDSDDVDKNDLHYTPKKGSSMLPKVL